MLTTNDQDEEAIDIIVPWRRMVIIPTPTLHMHVSDGGYIVSVGKGHTHSTGSQ